MATITKNAPHIEPDLEQLLSRARLWIRAYIWMQGIAALLVTLGLAFWIALAIDWWFEPVIAVRQGMLALAALAVACALYRSVLRRAFVPLSNRSMAVVLERRFPGYKDSLLTTVELTDRTESMASLGREMFSHTCQQARQQTGEVELEQVFSLGPLRRWLAAALVTVVSIAAFALLVPDAYLFGVQRLTTLSDAPWPRNTWLAIDGFEDGEAVVAKGTDLEVVVHADTQKDVPDVVQIRYRTEDGVRGRTNMVREGNADREKDQFQDFKHVFQSVLSPVDFEVRGGDARLRNLHIRVVDSPTIEMTLDCQYPAYTKLGRRELPVTGVMPLPLGTRVTVNAVANKDLVQAEVDYPTAPGGFANQTIQISQASESKRRFQFTLERLDADTTLAFTLLDADGIRNREPVRLALSAVPDDPPQLGLRLKGIGSAVTPQARLPLVGEITDDYGVSKTWFEYQVDEAEPKQQPFAEGPQDRNKLTVAEAFEIRDIPLKAGQKLLLGAKAADSHSHPENDQPNVGQSDRFLLDVVTPEQLRAMLESRELNLRQRFERIIEEMTESRDSLTRLDTPQDAAAGDSPKSDPPKSDSSKSGPADSQPDAPAESTDAEKTGDPADAEKTISPQQVLAQNLLRIERARQNGEKSAQETLGVALAFDDIREELINNRVDTEELKIRLKDYIADPLKVIAEEMFPKYDGRLEELKAQSATAADNPNGFDTAKQRTLVEADAILVEMNRVRDKMLELETFNEAIDLLRSIIALQQNVSEQTKKQRANQLRGLTD